MKEVPKSKRYALGWYHEGVTHLSIQEYEEAMAFFDKALSAIPDHPDFLVGKGDVLFAMGRFSEALVNYQRAVAQDTENYKAWLQIGITLLKLERFDDSLDVFRKLRSMNEYDGEVWLGLGISLLSLGKAGEAGDALKNAMRFKPNQPTLYYYLALNESDDDQALRYLLRGYRIDSSNLDIIIELVHRLVRSGRKADAAAFYRKARAIDPSNPRVAELEDVCSKKT
ncbi:MAG TPA: tetratricopeptide repeat protein [Methanomicrobiales archaeon]|jgi:tetratricopeptide (TPR) repeat protein|nr:tetratricopeptide repeat protein [Methanomicrobiales archaeon]